MATLAEAWVNIGANTAPLTAGLTQAEGKVAKATMQMQTRLKSLGTAMTIVGAIGTAAFALTVKSAIKFEKELAQVSTMLDKSTMSIMPKYKQALLGMSAAFGESTDTLSKGLYDILSASIDSSKALDVLEEAAKAAVAGITDTGVAADAITTIINSYGLEAEDAAKVSDQLFGIVKRGKTCVTGETRILLSNGKYERIDSLTNGAEVLSWTGKSFIPMQSNFHALGKKKIIRINTFFGREIRTTAEHPYLTEQGWKEVHELKVGDKIAVPSSLPIFGNKEPKWESFPKILGYLISDGCITRGTPIISSSSEEIIEEVKELVSNIGLKTSFYKKKSGNTNIAIIAHNGSGNRGSNPLSDELKRLGIYGTNARSKSVPKEVFQWKPKYILEFLEGLFNGDGWFGVKDQKEIDIYQQNIIRDKKGRFSSITKTKIGKKETKRFQVGYGSVSKQLVKDVSHLLIRFGINGTVYFSSGIYQWQTSRYSEVLQFTSLINLKRDKVQEFKKYEPIAYQLRDISSGIYFAKIKSKIEEPEEEVYDLTVPIFHNFVANDIIAHNTFAELAPAIGKVAATAAKSGLSFEELGASIATITRAGIRTDEAMTAVNGVLRAFLKPTDEAKKVAAEFGLTLDTNTLKTEGLIGAMNKLKNATTEQIAQMFPNIRGLKGVISAMGDLTGYTKDYNLMLNSAGLTQAAFEKQTATTAFKLEQLKKTFGVISVQIGDVLIPIVSDLIVKIGKVVTRISEWIKENPKIVDSVVKLGAALSVFTMSGGILILMSLYVGQLKIALVEMSKTITMLVIPAITKLTTAFLTMIGSAGPIGLLVLAVGGLYLAWEKNLFGMKDITDKVFASIKGNFVELANTLGGGGGGAGAFFDEIDEGLEEIGEGLEETGKTFDDFLEEVNKMAGISEIMQPAEEAIQKIVDAFTPYEKQLAAINEKYDKAIEKIKEYIKNEDELAVAIDRLNEGRTAAITLLDREKTATDKLNEAKKKLVDLTKSITDKIYEFTHTEYEVNLRDINREYDLLIENAEEVFTNQKELTEAIKAINDKRQEEIDKLKEVGKEKEIDAGKNKKLKESYEDLVPALDETTKKLKEAGEATEKLGILGGKSWEGITTQIKHATVALNSFTKEAVAAAIAQIKMNTYKLIQHIRETTLQAVGIYARMAEANIAMLEEAMRKQIDVIMYGLGVYEDTLASLGGATNALANTTANVTNSMINSWNQVGNAIVDTVGTINNAIQSSNSAWMAPPPSSVGGGTPAPSWTIPDNVIAVERGSYRQEIPSNRDTYNNTQNNTINIPTQGGNVQLIAKAVENVLYDMGRQFKRRGFEIIPGRG